MSTTELQNDFLERYLDNPEFKYCFIGYTSYSKTRITNFNSGVWLGYRHGTPFFEMQFRQTVPKEKFGQDKWTHIKALVALFDKVHPYIDSPPLVLISSKHTISFFNKAAYKWASIDNKEKSKIHFWLDTLTPHFEWFNILHHPFSTLRELAREDVRIVSTKISEKKFVDWTDLKE